MLLHLPLDVIHYVVREMLDYESKICLNRVLPPHERCCTRMKQSACISHQIKVSCLVLSSVIRPINEASDPMRRAACIFKCFERVVTPPHTLLIEHEPAFKLVLSGRAEKVLSDRDMHAPCMLALSRNTRKRLYRAAARVIRACTVYNK